MQSITIQHLFGFGLFYFNIIVNKKIKNNWFSIRSSKIKIKEQIKLLKNK